MKKLMLAAMVVLTANSVFAQRYMTRTGKITFFSSTPIEKIEAFNNEVSAVMDTKTGDIMFQAPVKSFKFEKALMQDHFNESYMESDKYPKSEFKGKITNPGAVNFSKDGQYNVTAAGKLAMHGVTKDVQAPGTITVKGKDVTVNSKFSIKPEDYGIKIPSMAASKIAKEIEITVNSILAAK